MLLECSEEELLLVKLLPTCDEVRLDDTPFPDIPGPPKSFSSLSFDSPEDDVVVDVTDVFRTRGMPSLALLEEY